MVLAAGLAPALATFSTSCLCIGLREQGGWSLQPVPPRQDCFTKEIRRLLRGGENGLPSRSSTSEGWSQSPVPPRTQRAYETHLSAGSTANGALTRSCTELIRLPSECIADNALRAVNGTRVR